MPDDLDWILETKPQQPTQPPPASAYANIAPAATSPTSSVMTRYTDGYRVARFIVTVGTTIKAVGVVLGIFIWLMMMSLGSVARMVGGPGGASIVAFLFAIILGGLVFALFYIFGVIISAHGQLLKANLDSAVHSSPFLSNEQRAQVMSLV